MKDDEMIKALRPSGRRRGSGCKWRPYSRHWGAIFVSFWLAVGAISACAPPGTPPAAEADFGDGGEPGDPISPAPPGIGQTDPNYKPRGLLSKSFYSSGRQYAAMDFQTQHLAITFDVSSSKAIGRSTIRFQTTAAGRPYLLLEAPVLGASISGQTIAVEFLKDPDRLNSLVALEIELPANDTRELIIEYELPPGRASFAGGGVGFLSDMADLTGRFFERYGPSSFEEDKFEMTLQLEVLNAKSEHRVFANGSVEELSQTAWRIQYPREFTSSSFFVHLTNRALSVNEFEIQGRATKIPVVVYSTSASLVNQASRRLPALFRELERDFGPYPHLRFVAYMGTSSGGMEYAGATITSLASLGHELLHSWFARSVMPADGRSGWIDEAIARWRDLGYPRASRLLQRDPTQLGGLSRFQRSTPTNSYSDGASFLAELDLLFKDSGGLKAHLETFARRYRYSLVTTDEFWWFLETSAQKNLNEFFSRYVFAGRPTQRVEGSLLPLALVETNEDALRQAEVREQHESLHPTPLTDAELSKLR